MEFDAVVLCGQGTRLEPLTNEDMCKALLPVGNVPLILHALEWCRRAAFKSITIFSNTADADRIAAVAKMPVHGVKNSDDALAKLATLQGDFVVMPVDFVTDIDPQSLINAHRNSSDALVSGFYYKNKSEQIDKKLLDADLVVSSNDMLLDVYSRQQTKANKYLDLRMAMLWKFPNVKITTDLLFSGIYFCQRKTVQLFSDIDGIETQGKPLWKLIRDLARRSWQHSEVLEPVRMHDLDAMDTDPFFIRANILPAYVEANRHLLKLHARKMAGRASKPIKKEGPAIGPDSIVDNSTELGDKSSVKRTVIGSNCKVGAKCRLSGCVIFSNVTIQDGAVLENCVLAAGAVIGSNCKLMSCTVEAAYQVSVGLEAKDEVLQGAIELQAVKEYESGESSEGTSGSDFDDYEVSDDDDDLFDRN